MKLLYYLLTLIAVSAISTIIPNSALEEYNNKQLFEAVQQSNIPAIEQALKQNADPDTQINGKSVLIQAIALPQGNEAIVKILLKKGANPNLSDDSKMTPLELAADNNDTKIIDLLLQYGADVTGRSVLRKTSNNKKAPDNGKEDPYKKAFRKELEEWTVLSKPEVEDIEENWIEIPEEGELEKYLY